MQSRQENVNKTVFYKIELKKIENNFAKKEVRVLHFCENRKRVILQT